MSFDYDPSIYAKEVDRAREVVNQRLHDVGGALVSRQASVLLEYLVNEIEALRDEMQKLREDAGL